MQNGKQERVKAGYHHGGGALPFAFVPHIVRFGSIAAYIRIWSVRKYAENGKALAYRGSLSVCGMVYSAQQIGICEGT